jgi:hypothetical protein
LAAVNLHHEEGLVGVEGFRGEVALSDIARPQLGRATGDEVMHAMLWLDALVEMVVSGQGERHAVLDEQRL